MRLPARIAAVMIGTILVFVLTVAGSNSWLGQALDEQARSQSLAQVRNARNNLLSQVRLTTIDYAKWETAVAAIDAADLAWTYDNIGAAATAGQVVQLVLIWGGRYAEDIGWTDDDVEDGRPGLLDPVLLGRVERRLADMPLGTYDTTEFFVWRKGAVYAVGAARLEVVAAPGSGSDARDEDVERLLMGRRVTDGAIAGIADSFVLTGLGIVDEAPADRPFVPLRGVSGEPIAYLAWDMPQPGTTMLHRMAPSLFLIVLLTVGLAALGMTLVRRSAQNLVVAEHSASKAARTDDMTGLLNRAAFNDAITRPARAGQRAILFLDVNGFKRINDSLGHAAGDLVIRLMAERLALLSAPDCVLARLGGDEFVFVVTGSDVEARTRRLTRSVEKALVKPVDVMGHQLCLRTAMGYAVQPTDDTSGDDLVRQADLAMYEAKRHRDRGPVAFAEMIGKADRDAQVLEGALRAAIARRGEISIAYQPIVAVGSGRLVRAEALARWTSPELGVVPPDRFIHVAEQSGLMVELGRKLLSLICDDLIAHPELRVSINVSAPELMAPTFVADLVAEFARRRINPTRVELELTEGVVVDDPTLAAQKLKALQEAGFSTALDDFGTGYSSIGYLQQMPFNVLKVDRSFVSGLSTASERLALCNVLILLGHTLGLTVACEGVETAEELDLLRELGCDLAQGYHLARPLPIDVLAHTWLDQPGETAAVA